MPADHVGLSVFRGVDYTLVALQEYVAPSPGLYSQEQFAVSELVPVTRARRICHRRANELCR